MNGDERKAELETEFGLKRNEGAEKLKDKDDILGTDLGLEQRDRSQASSKVEHQIENIVSEKSDVPERDKTDILGTELDSEQLNHVPPPRNVEYQVENIILDKFELIVPERKDELGEVNFSGVVDISPHAESVPLNMSEDELIGIERKAELETEFGLTRNEGADKFNEKTVILGTDLDSEQMNHLQPSSKVEHQIENIISEKGELIVPERKDELGEANFSLTRKEGVDKSPHAENVPFLQDHGFQITASDPLDLETFSHTFYRKAMDPIYHSLHAAGDTSVYSPGWWKDTWHALTSTYTLKQLVVIQLSCEALLLILASLLLWTVAAVECSVTQCVPMGSTLSGSQLAHRSLWVQVMFVK